MIVFLIGLLAQVFYTARVLVQWIRSEKAHRIESPTLFWAFSLMGSMLLFVYGWLRHDFSIVFGEFLSFYIYLWNLKAKGIYYFIPRWLPALLMLVPIVCLVYVAQDFTSFSRLFLHNANVPVYALVWGTTGQFIYKMRFVYQWYYSVRHHQSLLPLTSWYIAVTGSLMIIVYGLFRSDFILILGQVGIFASIRNIMLGHSAKEKKPHTQSSVKGEENDNETT